ncbi:MAG: CopD family protein [Methylibium sp.]|uniref:CopD family protein n=1 Tax=Methylibium sp. TaxID=2067992 RepID=UPI0017CA8C4B|nr:CopD family protein [Methylibium sp.]MBA3599153.1 CopD family protein [Methylibium sp.]
MPWLKLLHITSVIVWCGALLYLPAAIAAAAGPDRAAAFEGPRRHVLRAVFTLVATPAALLAIGSGTAIFVFYGPLAPWLIAKLATVSLLVLGHAACGALILRAESDTGGGVRGRCWAIAGTSLLWLAGIAWLVLRKPF